MTQPTEPERLAKTAYGVLKRFLKNLSACFPLTAEEEETIVLHAVEQHGKHLAIHRITQKNLDAFKFACWLGGGLLEYTEKVKPELTEPVIDALLKTLRELMIKETGWFLILTQSTMKLMKSLLLQEIRGDANHGIWVNGLYVSFHTSVTSWLEGKAYKIPL